MKGIRRTFAAAALVLASAVAVTAPAQAAHAEVTRSAHTQAPPFVSYHGLTITEHLRQVDSLRARGYRPITVSVSYDIKRNLRYAATWSTSGRALGGNFPWVMYHEMTPKEYQRVFDKYVPQGYYPAVVSAAGSGNDTRIAAIFLKRPNLRFIARHNIGGGELLKMSHDLRKEGMVLSSVDVYGPAGDRLYIAVWTANPSGADWKLMVDAMPDWHEFMFKSYVHNGYRLTGLAVSATGRYTSVWVKDSSTPWYSYIDMNATTYQKRFDELKAKGFYPVHISSEIGRYAAIWTK